MRGLPLRTLMTGPKQAPGDSQTKMTKLDIYRKVTLFGALPVIAIIGAFVLWQHRTPQERPEFIPYEYLRIRRKPFPWGDGNRTLFHNKHRNALPDGYED